MAVTLSDDEAAFRAFVQDESHALLRTAVLLAGDHHAGEDLLQAVLLKVLRHWPRIDSGNAAAYARRALATTAIDVKRRSRWRELSFAEVPDEVESRSDDPDQRLRLLAALRALPPRQRVIIVLRFYGDWPESEIAATLGISAGTVKSATHKGLAHLRLLVDRPATRDGAG